MKINTKLVVIVTILILILGVIVYMVLADNREVSEMSVPRMQETEDVRVAHNPREGKEKLASAQVVNNLSIKTLESGSRNPLMGVFLGTKKLGEFAALEVYKPLFSPDGSKAVFQASTVCGAECTDFGIYLVSIEEEIFMRIVFPRKDSDYSGEKRSMEDINYVMDSVQWIDNTTLKIVGFFASRGPEGNYRVSNMETWNYDVVNKTYSQNQ